MVYFTTEYDINTSGVDGPVSTTGFTGRRVINGNEYSETLLNISGNSNLVRVLFFGLNETNSDQYVQQSVYNVGRYGTTDIDWTNAFTVTTTNILTSNNDGNLVSLANIYKDIYFGGVTQTAATLKAYLDDMYGDHNGYSYILVNGGDLFNTTNFGNTSNATTCPVDYVYPWNGGSCVFADWITPTGYQYSIETSATAKLDAAASLIFGARVLPNNLVFDVYVDGTKDPNVSIRWSGDVNEDFSLQLVTPHVWTLPDSQPSYPYINDGGILVPNEANPRMRKYVYTFAGQYDAPYLTEFNNCTSELDAFTKTTLYGASGIATRMRYLLRFNKQKNENNMGVMTWGNCYIVDIPREVETLADITVTTLTPSTNNPEFLDEVVVHLGAPPDDIPDDGDDYPDGQDFDGNPDGVYEDDDIHDFDTGIPTGFSGKALLTKTYAMTALRTQNLGTKLWTQSYFDVLKIQNNPIENVVSMKWFPFSISGTDTEIKIGNVLMGTNGEVVDSIYKFTVGSAYYRSKNSKASYLDCSPYTQIKLHLPYCGIIQLDASEMLNRKITVSYVVDLVSGDCMAFIELDGTALGEKRIPFMSVSGHIGVDIPLTASNRIQAEMRAASTAISAVSGAAAHVISGDVTGGAVQAAQGALSVAGMDYTTQRTAAHSPACMTHENRTVFLEIWRPAYDEEISTNNGFKSRHGFPTYKYKTIGELSGFVKCDARTKIDFAMTGRENQMLEELLTSGVYV